MSSQRPRVLSIITHLALGGAENVALALMEALRDHFAFELFVVLAEGREGDIGRRMIERMAAANIPITFGTERAFKRGGVIEAAWVLRRLLNSLRLALVHVHTEIPELTLAIALALPWSGHRIPSLRTVHNTQLWPEWPRIGTWVERRLGEASVAAVSEAALAADDALRRRAGLPPLPPGRHTVIYNGVTEPVRRFSPRVAGPRRILFAGRFEAQKGADLLPQILAEAAERTAADAEVTLAGTGSVLPEVKRAIDGSGLRWKVEICPGIPDLGERIADYDVVLMPSRFEGLPLVAVEALMAGVPVVATDAPGLVEVVPADDPLSAKVDDVAGLATRLAACLDAPAPWLDYVGERLPALRARFGIDRMVASYRDLYAWTIATV
jgi:glycosyltransferase involved in cell wall biosynthesis